MNNNYEIEKTKALDWLSSQGLPVLPVAPAQDRYRYPKIDTAIKDKKGTNISCEWVDGKLVPERLYKGKNPSYLDKNGHPHIAKHSYYQTRLPSAKEHQEWFANPLNGIMTMGGWGNIAWIDIDVKQFSSQTECDRTVEDWLNKFPILKETFTERTHSGGWRFAVKVNQEPTFTNFALEARGKHVGEILWKGRVTVLAPTIGPSGNAYVNIQRTCPVEVENVEAIGLYTTTKERSQNYNGRILPQSLSPLPTVSGVGTVHLADLVTDKVRSILDGANPYNDRSASLTTAARELYGWSNWTSANRIPCVGRPEELIERAGIALGIDSDRISRIIKSINPASCQPAAAYYGESSCWKKVRRISGELYRKLCPDAIKNEIAGQIGQAFRITHRLIDSVYPDLSQFLSQSQPQENTSIPHSSLNSLRAWYKVCHHLERPESHLEAIANVAANFKETGNLHPGVVEEMKRDYQQYWQMVRSLVESSKAILNHLGEKQPDGSLTFVSPRQNYFLHSCHNLLTVTARNRGNILALSNGKITVFKCEKKDAEIFKMFFLKLEDKIMKIPEAKNIER
ncbi:MAG TPA: hypothetical protein V6D28_23385 [Leptolyngbyaceae cyanobacterium]